MKTPWVKHIIHWCPQPSWPQRPHEAGHCIMEEQYQPCLKKKKIMTENRDIISFDGKGHTAWRSDQMNHVPFYKEHSVHWHIMEHGFLYSAVKSWPKPQNWIDPCHHFNAQLVLWLWSLCLSVTSWYWSPFVSYWSKGQNSCYMVDTVFFHFPYDCGLQSDVPNAKNPALPMSLIESLGLGDGLFFFEWVY